MKFLLVIGLTTIVATLAACAVYPTGPSLMALPGSGASFDQFRADDLQCQSYAQQVLGGRSAQSVANESAVNSATVGTLVGAAAGALVGAASGNPGAGAAIGAGSGLVLGGAAGSDAYHLSGYRAQDRFDAAYIQCMYAKGHQVPVAASGVGYQQGAATVPNLPPPGTPAPNSGYPPPGTPPPPGY